MNVGDKVRVLPGGKGIGQDTDEGGRVGTVQRIQTFGVECVHVRFDEPIPFRADGGRFHAKDLEVVS